jgi:prepilin-type N-terminal cleavage/methylation domain-containing protein
VISPINSTAEESGYSLVEVMVAIVVLTVAVVPMVGMFEAAIGAADASGAYDKARTCAVHKLEQVKSLPYEAVEGDLQDGVGAPSGFGYTIATQSIGTDLGDGSVTGPGRRGCRWSPLRSPGKREFLRRFEGRIPMVNRARSRPWKEEAGFTLVEVLVAATMMFGVLFALYAIFDVSVRAFGYGGDRLEAVGNARLDLGWMELEIRAAYPYDLTLDLPGDACFWTGWIPRCRPPPASP